MMNMVKSDVIQSVRDNIAVVNDLHWFESTTERLEFIDSFLADNKNFFLSQSVWEVVYTVQIEHRESQKLLANC